MSDIEKLITVLQKDGFSIDDELFYSTPALWYTRKPGLGKYASNFTINTWGRLSLNDPTKFPNEFQPLLDFKINFDTKQKHFGTLAALMKMECPNLYAFWKKHRTTKDES